MLERAAGQFDAPAEHVVCDVEFRILSWSQGAPRMLDFDVGTAIGRNTLELLAADDAQRLTELLGSGGYADGASVLVKLALASEPRSLNLHMTSLFADRDARGFVLAFRELHATERSSWLGGSTKVLEVVTHELNNVLTVVRTYAYFARRTTSRNTLAHDLRVVAAAAERGTALTDWLASTSESAPRAAQELSAAAFLSAVAARLRLFLPEGTTVGVAPLSEDVPFRANAVRLEHAVMSLVLSLDQALVGSAFLLAVQSRLAAPDTLPEVAPAGYVALSVSCRSRVDHGQAAQPSVVAATKLNLDRIAPLRELVSSMGGSLDVVAGDVDEIRFELVLAAPGERSTPRAKLKLAPPVGTGVVLVVEDEAAIRIAVRRALSNVGYSVLEAADGVAARQLLLEHGTAVSLLIVDLILPEGGGPELFAWARATCPKAAVLIISGQQREAEAEASALGAQYLAKPFYPAELLAAVRRALSAANVGAEITDVPDEQRVVLVVDDDADMRDSFERLLSECDFETVIVSSGLHALQLLDARHVDAVVVDQFMPGLDGIGLLELVHQRFPGTTRILCTGHPASDIVMAAVNRGRVHRVLAKTMHAVALRDEIERAVLEAPLRGSLEDRT